MYAKAMETAGQSFGRIRGWFSQLRVGNMVEGTENDEQGPRTTSDINHGRQGHPFFFEYSRASSEPTGFMGASTPSHSSAAERGRNHSLSNRGYTAFQDGMSEQASAQRRHISDLFIEEEILISCQEVAEVDRYEKNGASKERFENTSSSYSITSTEMSADSGFIMGHLPKQSMSTSNSAVSTLFNETGFRNRSQTLDARAGRPRQNTRSSRPIPRNLQHSQSKEYEDYVNNGGSDGNLGQRERKVSICSITKITRSIFSKEDRDDCSSKNYAVFMEEVQIKSCEEMTLETFDESLNGEEETGVEQAGELKMSQDLMSQAMSTRGPITGRVKLCLQHFEASKVLRVIVLRASNLKAKRGFVYGKLSAQFVAPKSNKKKVLKLAKQKASSEVSFNEQVFFDNIDEDDMDRLTLSVRLYNREGIFKSKRCLGEMVIPLFKYDLSMDTNVRGYLREQRADLKNLKIFDDDGDLEVISEDRSIAACVAASLNKSAVPKSPRFKKMRTKDSYNTRRDCR